MAGDARDLPLGLINSTAEFVVFSHDIGIVAQDATATDAVHALMNHLREFPRSDAAIFRRSVSTWRIY